MIYVQDMYNSISVFIILKSWTDLYNIVQFPIHTDFYTFFRFQVAGFFHSSSQPLVTFKFHTQWKNQQLQFFPLFCNLYFKTQALNTLFLILNLHSDVPAWIMYTYVSISFIDKCLEFGLFSSNLGYEQLRINRLRSY